MCFILHFEKKCLMRVTGTICPSNFTVSDVHNTSDTVIILSGLFRVAYRGVNPEIVFISLRCRRNRWKFAIRRVYSLCTHPFPFSQVDQHISARKFILRLFLKAISSPNSKAYSVACTHSPFCLLKNPAHAGFSFGSAFIPRCPLINEGNVWVQNDAVRLLYLLEPLGFDRIICTR